jgi:hypothetical protein
MGDETPGFTKSVYRQIHTRTASAPDNQAPAARKGLMILYPNRSHANADKAKANVVTTARMSSQATLEVGRSVGRSSIAALLPLVPWQTYLHTL